MGIVQSSGGILFGTEVIISHILTIYAANKNKQHHFIVDSNVNILTAAS